ncbi:branched-chain amino acid aminotransferase II [Gloeophyllum trabeum ATCC 11539]|uniref:Branched-chain-amino-acid aminotransferase n=1 Tax=Gloeophyllum trabeum (strain ATCC 11539 / FP-39264 / Madison 617) TaxID=670483 RepID=S7S5M9_GLOTA|nr:branched-chain amino acid aminotransferase II [Gloeophyllum trabeum ATCC 11539]EPQ61304.1 branched-chain amino acid aminotransferase II [Gloeophyllum trabeum ATCC 11539]
MANGAVPNGSAKAADPEATNHFSANNLAPLDASKVTVTLTKSPKPIPPVEELVFGQQMTDHMLVATFDPAHGWSAPEIKPYGPLSLDPASSCFQYCPNVFEGMKAYLGPDGEPRLFRPELNMARMQRSAARVALPPFSPSALLALIKRMVLLERRWIPRARGCALYIRPTIIGTRPALGVSASDHALLYIILSPMGPYFRTGPKPISLLGVCDAVRAWPGGTGGYKLGLNYAPGFEPQKRAAQKGYMQVLWLFKEGEGRGLEGLKVTEAGAMNFFVVVKRADGDLDVITPPLDGTILPGLTRDSCLALVRAHTPSTRALPALPPATRVHAHERTLTVADLVRWYAEGRLLEAFGVGTAVVVVPVGRIGYEVEVAGKEEKEVRDVLLPEYEGGYGPVARALWERVVEIQEGRAEWERWSVSCEEEA